jgi:hypothetical protein
MRCSFAGGGRFAIEYRDEIFQDKKCADERQRII